MKNRILVEIGYHYYLLPAGVNANAAFSVFNGMVECEREYTGSKEIFTPKSKEQRKYPEFKIVPAERVRELTPEEKENKEISELKGTISYRDSQIKEKDKEIEDLKCKLTLLSTPAESRVKPEFPKQI